MPDRRCRGDVLLGILNYVKKQWGKQGLESCCNSVGIDYSGLKEGNWYPDEYNDRIYQWIEFNHGMEYIEKSGIFTVQDLGLLGIIVRFKDITYVLNETAKQYKQAFTFGSFDVVYGENRAVVTIKDNTTTKYSCPAWTGVFKGALEMTKSKGTVTKTKCELNGYDCCEYVITWHK